MSTQPLTGNVKQTYTWDEYTAGDCSCGKCSAFTKRGSCGDNWNIGNTTCCGGFCTAQPRCSHILERTCPVIDNTEPQAQWDPKTKAPNILCSYPPDVAKTTTGVETWINNFGRNESFNQSLMPRWCSDQIQGSCPIDPATGKEMPSCNRASSTLRDGLLCQQWAMANPTLSDSTMQSYCNRINTPDCGCLQRNLNPLYQAIKGSNTWNDGCWWRACADPTHYLVPSYLKPKPGDCPTTVCQAVQNIVNSKKIDLKDVVQYVSCNINPPAPPPPGPPTPPPPGPPIPPFPSGPSPLVIALIALAVIGLFIFGAYFFFSRRSGSA